MTPISTPFGPSATAAEVVAGLDLSGQRAIVTGGASGIGLEITRALAGAGAEVTVAVRNMAVGRQAAADLAASGGRVRALPLDLADRASVEAFVASWDGPLHMLVNNAGLMATPEARTPEGWELQFATNHLGHFNLANGLHAALVAANGARIVSVSSAGHLRSPIVFDDIHFVRRPYDPLLAYGQSKTANILFAVEANRRWQGDGIFTNAVMPGAVLSGRVRELVAAHPDAPALEYRSPEQGAAPTVMLAASPLLDGVGGRYFENGQEAAPHVPGTVTGVAAYALDPEQARRLWDASLELLG